MESPPYEVLTWFERLAFRTMRSWNQGAAARVGYVWQRKVIIPFVGAFVTRRLEVRGLERVTALPRDARILLVANHRTFFDLFVLGWILWRRGGLLQRLSFPVRGNFFYENPLGLAIGLGMSGGTMFPPFFRPVEKKLFNKHSLGILIDKLKTPNQLVGFHPEGTRNKTDDPYTLLPAQPGAGELALKARPYVVPAFITGLTNSVWGELKANFRRERTVVAIYGDPVELPLYEGETRLSHHKKTADLMNERILALAEEEKAVRARLSAPSPPPPASR
jgi:1-acyl-sn-glycerol-3-phosphate acyltransferase